MLAAGTCLAVLLWNRGNVAFPPGEYNGEIDVQRAARSSAGSTGSCGSIGAFPFRDQPAPLEVYVLVLLVLVTLLVAAVRRGAGVGRRAVVLATALFFLVPSVLVAITLQDRGGMWQGRYSLPFTAGVMMLAGLVLDRVRWRSNPRDIRPQALALVMLALAHAVSVVHVQLAELNRAVSADDAGWLHPPTAGTAILMALAWVVFGAVALSMRSPAATDSDAAPSRAEVTPETSR